MLNNYHIPIAQFGKYETYLISQLNKVECSGCSTRNIGVSRHLWLSESLSLSSPIWNIPINFVTPGHYNTPHLQIRMPRPQIL